MEYILSKLYILAKLIYALAEPCERRDKWLSLSGAFSA